MQGTLALAILCLVRAHVTLVAASGSIATPGVESSRVRPLKPYASRSLLDSPRYLARQPGLNSDHQGMPSSETSAELQGHATDIFTLQPVLTQIGRIPISGSEIQSQAAPQSSTITGNFLASLLSGSSSHASKQQLLFQKTLDSQLKVSV